MFSCNGDTNLRLTLPALRCGSGMLFSWYEGWDTVMVDVSKMVVTEKMLDIIKKRKEPKGFT